MDEVTLNIISNGMNGEGVARDCGKVFFIDGAVEGDTVCANIVKENRNYSIGIIKEMLSKSPHRCEPKCKYFGECGGCALQHITYKKQLEIKRQNIVNLLNKVGLNNEVLNVIESKDIFNYRNKITVYLSPDNKLGFYKKNSKKLIGIDECAIADSGINNLIKLFTVFLQKNREFSFVLKGISIRKIENVYLLNLILSKKVNLQKLDVFLKQNKFEYSMYYCINAKDNLPTYPVIKAYGNNTVRMCEFGITYNIYPMSFLQINNKIKEEVYRKILSLIDGGSVVVDAYSGAGLLSAIVAKKAKKVYAIEIDVSASRACSELALDNKIDNLIPINGDCMNEVPKLLDTENIDVILLDPARKGVDKSILLKIAEHLPKRIIYLSCNPATLVRDLDVLCKQAGYKIIFIQPYDMFPQTSDVETLCLLELE